MAKLEIELAPEEQKQIQQEAERARLTVEDWIRHQLLHKPAFITDDGQVFEIPDLPDDLGRACAVASEATLQKFWDAPVPLSGEEEFKTRPALVMAVLPYGRGSDCLLCIITTQRADDPHLLALEVSDIEGGRLTQRCYLRPTYTHAVAEHMIKRRLGRLNDDELQAAVQSLVSVLTV